MYYCEQVARFCYSMSRLLDQHPEIRKVHEKAPWYLEHLTRSVVRIVLSFFSLLLILYIL
jgi:hypothetical protein